MLSISKNKCVGCGICEKECPNQAVMVDIPLGFAVIDREECAQCNICVDVCPQKAIKAIQKSIKIAIGTDDEKMIKQDDHFGMSKYFQIWSYSDGEITFLQSKKNAKYEEDEARVHGDPKKAKATSSVLKGVDVIVGKFMGPNITLLGKKFVVAITREPNIRTASNIIKENINEIMEEYEKQERMGIILT